ncbi:hypothetical protein [Allonocardiopsis opalescens]|uniref:Uncharacterized protein n=1 Tax=Allonocardiopsis opalescens TaxID=1144618 RepID=A0A2T0Q9U6_9ACTN|nr:hypothetical protein [Allonocardiopsis opalescens]PRY00634.1 hypothetical protein CLV72_102265 [Allonocardiopsis opalescens]
MAEITLTDEERRTLRALADGTTPLDELVDDRAYADDLGPPVPGGADTARPEPLPPPSGGDTARRGDAPPEQKGFDLERPLARLDDPDRAETPLETLRAFDPSAGGLPPLIRSIGVAYIDQVAAAGDRPWLAPAADRSPEVKHVIAALDRGSGHPLPRHEGAVTLQQLTDRVTRLQDPAQLDPGKLTRSRDAYTGKRHNCGLYATRINDPDAFAVAYVRALQHPDVRAVLNQPFVEGQDVSECEIPIADLLGPDGHRFCEGTALNPVNGSLKEAVEQRKQWTKDRVAGVEPTAPEPTADPIATFEGGTIKVQFKPNVTGDRYECASFFPDPA